MNFEQVVQYSADLSRLLGDKGFKNFLALIQRERGTVDVKPRTLDAEEREDWNHLVVRARVLDMVLGLAENVLHQCQERMTKQGQGR